uniref:uncharacterized protein LOC122598084 n=1 Tax=Erigeron canadensis TaxID=72917 RepID=UPI001CB8DF31|nr:uncharacterized protein LOC122598084 [Erigeron canadensis]
MSQFLPFEIQEEILKRINDIRSLLRLRSISKAWKSLIDSPRFIADPERQRRHLILVVINGVIYWLAFEEGNTVYDRSYALIISFDLTTEEFEEIYFPPDNLIKFPESLANQRETLVVIDYCYNNEAKAGVCGVWAMNHPKSFTKLYSVIREVPRNFHFDILEFTKNGDPILQTRHNDSVSALEIYEPCSECYIELGYRSKRPKSVTCYIETLLLLNQSDSIIDHV